METTKKFIFWIVFASTISSVSTHLMTPDCPQERLVLDCAPELIEVYIADHPDVCDGLCAELAQYYDADWQTYPYINNSYINESTNQTVTYKEYIDTMHWHNSTYEEANVTWQLGRHASHVPGRACHLLGS